MQKFDEATEQGRELRDAYGRSVTVARLHREAEKTLTKGAMVTDLQQLQIAKSKIADFRKSLDKKIKDFEKIGGTWDNEIERENYYV